MEERIVTTIIAVAGVVTLMVTWVWVQVYWKQTFSDQISDEDVLAGRNSCGDCGCGTACSKQLLNKEKTK